MISRPTPQSDPATSPYWEGTRAHRLLLPRCDACGEVHFYPRAICPHCGSNAFTWIAADGQGTVFSCTTVRRAPSPAFESQVPYVVAIVALDEGPHLMTNIVDCDPDKIHIGDRVRVAFLDVEDASQPASLPVFVKV